MTESRMGVVIPTFNSGTYVLEAVASAIKALGAADNVVVVDDGSTDRVTRSALARVVDLGVTVHRQRNLGVSVARNVGLELLSTPHAFVLDSDDLLGENAPRVASDILEGHPDVAIVAGAGTEFDDNGWSSDPISATGATREAMRHGSLIATASAFRLSDWRVVGGFPTGLATGEEWVFWMRLLKLRPVVACSDEVFVHRRMHARQVTRQYVDPRHSAKALHLVMRESPELFVAHPDELLDRFLTAHSLLAEYRHAYRHLDRAKVCAHALKARVRRLRRPGRGTSPRRTHDE